MAEVDFTGERGKKWRFDPERRLGERGGFASVHPGTADDGTPVAVKVVDVGHGVQAVDPALLRRELEIARKLEGVVAENLIAILDAGELDGDVVIVMERADETLAVNSALPQDAAVAVLRDIAHGLIELHQVGIIHRDLKPSNVLKVGQTWKLADFGIARDEEVGTQNPTFVGWGTHPYMAPELWGLSSPNVKSDLYALGCIAYELLTGDRPFRGPSMEDYRRQHTMELPAPLPGEVNPVLRALVVDRMLAKDPALRPQDARAVHERLARLALPLRPVQQRLQEVAARHDTERAALATVEAQRLADVARVNGLIGQAFADLEELATDAVAEIASALPEVGVEEDHRVSDPRRRYTIRGPDARLVVSAQPVFSPVPADTMIVAGTLEGSSRRRHTSANLANIVYEETEGRYSWRQYRFRASALVREYTFGPDDRDHGIDLSWFEDPSERAFMIRPPMHVWTLEKSELDADAFVLLYTEALDLID